MSTLWPHRLQAGDLIQEHAGHGPVRDVKNVGILRLAVRFADGHEHRQPAHRRVHVANR